jgi:Putative peptidoglycan binding domain
MNFCRKFFLLAVLLLPIIAHAYPLDGYQETGIRRIEAARLAVLGKMPGRQQPPGALLPSQFVQLRLLDYPDLELPAPDPEFTAKIVALLGSYKDRYGIAALDISNPANPVYAEYRGDYKQNVGSVGKIVVGLAIFQALADIYPDDIDARKRILHDTIITADKFIQSDHHTVRLWNPETGKLTRRPIHLGDKANFWEWLDWMLSASSNAAAATMMKQAMLLVHYGKQYPVADAEAIQFFDKTPKKQLGQLFAKTFHEPITRNGLNLENLRQGSFFTRYGKSKVPGTTSYGTARELMLYTLRMEQGRLVDVFSSLELKRLLYMTERRIRYASSPALSESAVYFKSGSLYKCRPEPGFVCKKYRGNVRNYMNSVAIVESPAGENHIDYMVTLISNVLYKNSAVEHQTLATRIHRLIEAMHPLPLAEPGSVPAALSFGENLIGYEEKRQQRMLVVNTQAALEKLGYPVGGIDGKIGPNTRSAIKKFQTANNLKADGQPSTDLLEKLNAAVIEFESPAPPPSTTGFN